MAEDKIFINNPINDYMKYGEHNFGVATAPDYLPKYDIYKPSEGYNLYNTLQYDLYQQQQKAKPAKKDKNLPKILKYTAISLITAVLCLLSAKPIMNLISKFKK